MSVYPFGGLAHCYQCPVRSGSDCRKCQHSGNCRRCGKPTHAEILAANQGVCFSCRLAPQAKAAPR